MRQTLSFILCAVFLIAFIYQSACTVPTPRKTLPGRRQQLPGKSQNSKSQQGQQSQPATQTKPGGSTKPLVIVPTLEPKSYIDPGRFIMVFKDQFNIPSGNSPYSFTNTRDQLINTCTFGKCSDSTIRNYVSSFYAALREKQAKSERFCHHLLSNHAKDMAHIFDTEDEPIIFSELWHTCSLNSFYRPASSLKPARRAKIDRDVYLDPMLEHALLLPDNIFVPSEIGKDEVEIVRFIGDSKVQYLVESMTPGILAATARAPHEVRMRLFQKLFIERPFDKKGIRFPQHEKSWSFWSWLFGSSDE